MKLESRLSRLEETMATDEHVVFSVWSGEDAGAKQSQAWNDYKAQGGAQEYSRTTFVRINKLAK